MQIIKKIVFPAAVAAALLTSCNSSNEKQTDQEVGNTDSLRIVSINGAASEVLAEFGLLNNIVGTDVTSTYPEALNKLPKVGHNKNISAEGILALEPNIIIGTNNDLKPETLAQLKQSGIRVVLVPHEHSTGGSIQLIKSLADSLNISGKGDSLANVLREDLHKVAEHKSATETPKVLFIYARGAGTMMVGGKGTEVDEMIALAGGTNVAQDIQEYKPLTAEALVAYNPDVILLFDSGLSSLGGIDGILNVQGIKETNAGKNKKIVEMDGAFLTGFGPRVAKAIDELYHKIH
ncbi:helical backbone metal receptor [Sphingobacterium sp. lm-10]|uniref:heme/hemin ABC transporter substrate-binding protein n=1 Tax=Sphingobacterium sp. lm-10 TaxID=2944904 RepID=UPI00202291EA|nr:helical backbone metal receptor [Sphingobacterium sp. lm-10]MCL7988929.1 helical backbone metal receptor [Sphingobacterium sp. lm-10]